MSTETNKYEEGRMIDGAWVRSPVQIYVAGRPNQRVAHVVFRNIALTPTFAGLLIREQGVADKTLTGRLAYTEFMEVMRRAHGNPSMLVVTLVYPAEVEKSDVEIYPIATMPSLGLHLNESLDVLGGGWR